MDTLVDRLLASPRLALHVQTFEKVLESERQQRERFYQEITEHEKAEFINGKIVVHSPVKKKHNEINARLLRLVGTYVQIHDLGFVGFEKILVSLTRNDYEPDLCFFGNEKARLLTPDQGTFPPPDFITEILSPATEAHDRGLKYDDYAAHGVKEYWIVDPGIEVVEQFLLKGDTFVLTVKAGTGTLSSLVIPDFCIPVRALFDDQVNLQVLREIL